MILIEKGNIIHESIKGEGNILKVLRRNKIVLNEKQVFTSLAITCQKIGTQLLISTMEWNFFLKYLVAKSINLGNADRRELNLIPSVTSELALCKGWYKGFQVQII